MKPSNRHALAGAIAADIGAGRDLLGMPFDVLRFQHASAVLAGLCQRSLRASGEFERLLDALEKLALGPFARRR